MAERVRRSEIGTITVAMEDCKAWRPGRISKGTSMFSLLLNGYGLVLVDAQGIVRKINPRGNEIESAVGKVLGDPKPPH